MPLPAHLLHDLRQSSSVLPLEHDHHLGRLAALARCAGFLRLGGAFALGRVLGGSGLLSRLALRGRALGRLCATFGLSCGFRLCRICGD
jgi:hypothetical protein